ncbi:hypothetical protein GCM10011273_05910 [Asticcacaulis endophyticus]|uniref:Uncharacterized protein n=1 Tax=Asticcacaulis endophyticus TaxID=1395890 RepID=A0A918PVW7_9CAUL|nr:hypothetical protein GCM10011273_05910 [Asticcacaulis endophyticus]
MGAAQTGLDILTFADLENGFVFEGCAIQTEIIKDFQKAVLGVWHFHRLILWDCSGEKALP